MLHHTYDYWMIVAVADLSSCDNFGQYCNEINVFTKKRTTKGRQSYWHEKYSRTIKIEPKAFLNEILYEIENGHHFAKREINAAVTCN